MIWDFMDHHECQGEVGLGNDAEAILLALVKQDSISHARLFRSLPQHFEHFLLEIDGDDLAAVPNDLRHRNRAEAHATADIHRRHARFYVWADDLLRVVEKATKWVIDEVTAPPGANVRHGRSPDYDPIIVQSPLWRCEMIHEGKRSVMRDQDKTKEQLISELEDLRGQVAQRKRAEDALRENIRTTEANPEEPLTAVATKGLVHELQVHQIELEMPNDELRRPQRELELLEHGTSTYTISLPWVISQSVKMA